jgi:hypothetical protein
MTNAPDDALRFASVSCSQCGQFFGAGNHGFSHCEDHAMQTSSELIEDLQDLGRDYSAAREAITRIAALESALVVSQDALRQAQEDAARYRLLRDPFGHGAPWLVVKRNNDQATMAGVVLDKAIDAILASVPSTVERDAT